LLKGKIKLGGCITNTIIVLGTLLFAFASILNIYTFFANEYSWLSLAIGTLWFAFFCVSLNALLTHKYSKKIIFCICIMWCVTLIVSAVIGYVNRERSVEYNLLGEWIAETDEIKSKVVFEGNENDLEGTWSIYDYENGKKEVIDFEVEDIENYTMEIVTKDGDIMFVPFAVSKDTLYFNDIEHKNPDKNVKIPKGTITYIEDGIIKPVVNSLFIGMSKEEVEKVIRPTELEKEEYNGHIHYYYYEIPDTDLSCRLEFSDKEVLEKIEVYTNEKESLNDIIEILSNSYGNYERTENKLYEGCNYCTYEWKSNNMIIELEYQVESDYYWITYKLDFSWKYSNY